MIRTINTTIKLKHSLVLELEDFLRSHAELEVISFKVVPSTEKLYNEDKYFKKLVKDIKTLNDIKERYINKNNYDTED